MSQPLSTSSMRDRLREHFGFRRFRPCQLEAVRSAMEGRDALIIMPTGSGKRWGKSMIYRLSVSGIATRKEAVRLCVEIKANGGDCFVRSMRGDRPMTWGARPRTDQLASIS